MKLSLKKPIFSIAAAIIALVALLSPTGVSALDQNLQISPTHERLTLDPGTTYDGTMKVRNIGTDTFSYHMELTPFSVLDENYNSDFTVASNYTKIVDWITFDQETGTVAPDETDIVTYHIHVPDDAPGGAQHAAIVAVVDNDSNTEEGSVSIKTVSRAALILYANVNGETNDCGEVISNNVPSFFFAPPVSVNSVVKNCGNVDNEAKFSLKVWPLFSDEELYDSSADEKADTSDLILPDTTRYHAMSWQDGSIFGIYNVEHSIEYGGKTNTVKKLVFVIPLWLIIIFILLVGLIIFKLVSNAQSRKQSKKK